MIIYFSFALLKIIVTLYKTHDSMEDLSKCTELRKIKRKEKKEEKSRPALCLS